LIETGREERGASRFLDKSEGVISGGGAWSVDLDIFRSSKGEVEERKKGAEERPKSLFNKNVSECIKR